MEQEEVWNRISKPWKKFRVNPLEEVRDFLKDKKGNVLDLGCGSGRNFIKINGTLYGVDFSSEQLAYAKEYAEKKGIKVILKKASAEKLPFDNNFFDSAIFIATLHCIDSAKKREKSLKELLRVLKPGAEALISVWSRNQKRLKNKPKEGFIPWTVDEKKYERYTYIYEKDEFIELLKSIGFKIIKLMERETSESFYSQKNFVAVVQKV